MFFSLSLLDLAVVLATILGVGMLVPQARDLARNRDFRGVSAGWIGGGLAINSGWLVYALAAGLPGLLPVSLGALVLYGWMSATLVSAAPELVQPALRGVAVIVGVCIVAGLVGGLAAFGLTIALTYSAQFTPAAWSAVSSADLSGVSMSTWAMALIEAVTWAVYGWYLGDTALTIGGAGASVMSSIVVLGLLIRREAPTRRRRFLHTS